MKTKQTRIIFAAFAALALIVLAVLFAGAAGAERAQAAEEPACAVQTLADETTGGETAAESEEDGSKGWKAIAAGVAIGLAAAAGAIGMGIAIAKASESVARQPEAEGKIRSNLMLGLVFIETAIIYALIVSILIIFVL